jgi:hypothetical protein
VEAPAGTVRVSRGPWCTWRNQLISLLAKEDLRLNGAVARLARVRSTDANGKEEFGDSWSDGKRAEILVLEYFRH